MGASDSWLSSMGSTRSRHRQRGPKQERGMGCFSCHARRDDNCILPTYQKTYASCLSISPPGRTRRRPLGGHQGRNVDAPHAEHPGHHPRHPRGSTALQHRGPCQLPGRNGGVERELYAAQAVGLGAERRLEHPGHQQLRRPGGWLIDQSRVLGLCWVVLCCIVLLGDVGWGEHR